MDASRRSRGDARSLDVPRPVPLALVRGRVDATAGRGTSSNDGAHARALQKTCGERLHLGVRTTPELRLNPRRVEPRVPQCGGPVACGRERSHESQCRAPAERIELGELTPPRNRRRAIAGRLALARQSSDRVAVQRRQPLPFRRDPFLERGKVEMEAVEKRTAVDARGGGKLAPLQRLLELGHIGGDDGRVQPQRVGAQEGVGPELLAEVVQQLMQRVTRRFRGALGTEQSDEPIPCHASFGRRR